MPIPGGQSVPFNGYYEIKYTGSGSVPNSFTSNSYTITCNGTATSATISGFSIDNFNASNVNGGITTVCEGRLTDATYSRHANPPSGSYTIGGTTFTYSSSDDDYWYYTSSTVKINEGNVAWSNTANGSQSFAISSSTEGSRVTGDSPGHYGYHAVVRITIGGVTRTGTYDVSGLKSPPPNPAIDSYKEAAFADAINKFGSMSASEMSTILSAAGLPDECGKRVRRIAGDYTDKTGIAYYGTPSKTQELRTSLGVKIPKTVKLEVNKTTNSNYTDIVKNNSNYSLDGTTFDVYYNGHIQNDKNGNHTITIDADGNSNTLEFNSDWAGYTLQLRETKAGKGYKLLSSDIDVKLGNAGSTTTKEISNIPIVDPALIQLQKESDLTKSADFNGTINPNGAVYTITQYTDAVSGTSGPKTSTTGRTWTYTTQTLGNPGVAGMINTALSPTTGTAYIIDGASQFPLGTYKIIETSVPKDSNGTETGLKLSSTTYYVVLSKSGETVRKQIYAGSTLVYDCVLGSQPTVRNTDYIKSSTIVDNVTVSVEETENWYKIGVVKVDKTKADGGVTGVGTTPSKNVPQGDATFNGAKYYLYTTKNISTKFFSKSQNKQLYTLQSAGNNLWQVYNANGTPVVITTGNDGFGQTPSTLPYADCYAVREFNAPTGYKLDSTLYTVTSKWTKDNGATIIDTFVVGPQTYNVPTVTGYRGSKGDVADDVTRFNLAVKKKDVVTNEDGTTTVLYQGDATLAGIRYAVVNRSANPVVFNGKDFAKNRIVTVITTNANGDANVSNIPYGSYEVYELRADAQSDANVIGQNVAAGVTDLKGSVFGISKYANFINGKPSGYLHSEDSIDVPTTSMKDTVIGKKITGHPTEAENGKTYTVDTYYNEPVKNTITVVKKDIELNKEDANQGVNKLSGIEFAVINNSKKDSSNPLNGGVWYKGTFYEVGDVVEVLTTDEHGSATTDELPFGTYIIRELRKDNLVEPGDVWANLTSDKLGTSIYANDYYIYTDTKNDTINETYTTHDSTQRVVSLSPAISTEVSEAVVRDINADAPVRGDIDFLKVNIDGDVMSYIPFMIQHLDKDKNVLETHVVLTDAQGHINTETRKNKSYSTINSLDSRLQYKDDGT
ncbi:MAG: hypothetical protein II625_07475, partial [Bacilli bacterium]|nr:hypothetical protein [Bacilli bacterium]